MKDVEIVFHTSGVEQIAAKDKKNLKTNLKR